MTFSSIVLNSAEDRERMLRQRKVESDLRLKDVATALKHRNRAVPDDDDGVVMERTGCFNLGGCFRFGRTRVRTAEVTSSGQAQGEASTDAKRVKGGLLSKFMSGSKAHAAARLDEAASLLSERIENLEQRMASAREEAKIRMQAGQKSNALRALKRSKMLELSLSQASTALGALDRQRELFAEAELNKQVTGAISDTMKTMKKTCKAANLSGAERAIDDAQDVQDGLTDLNDVMSQFSASGLSAAGADDEDALLDELNAMVEVEECAPHPVQETRSVASASKPMPSVPASLPLPSVPSDESGTTEALPALPVS